MRREDLMIGFWYKWYAENKYYYLQVTSDTFKFSDDTIANFEPIELTPEILEQNGWHKDSLFDDWYGPVNIYGHNAPFITIGSAEIRYVHELQMLLKLHKKDINLKLESYYEQL